MKSKEKAETNKIKVYWQARFIAAVSVLVLLISIPIMFAKPDSIWPYVIAIFSIFIWFFSALRIENMTLDFYNSLEKSHPGLVGSVLADIKKTQEKIR